MNPVNSSARLSAIDASRDWRRKFGRFLFLWVLGQILSSLCHAADFDWKGEITLEASAFEDDSDPGTEDFTFELVGLIELDHAHGSFRERLRILGRTDAVDSDRAIVLVEEAWVEYRKKKFQLRFGIDKFNWSATEAFHPADVLNSRHLDSDLENFEKLGEPVLGVVIPVNRGELSIFYLPVHIDPENPSRRSRLNLAPSGWTFEDPIWGRRDGSVDDDDFADQWMVRWLQSRGSFDFDFHFIRHSDRSQPVFLAFSDTETIQPVHLAVQQIGGTLQGNLASWLVKLEWAYRDFSSLKTDLVPGGVIDQPSHWRAAWGVEYNWSYVGGGTSTWILEGQFVLGVDEKTRADLDIFQQDVLLGYQHDFGDIQGRQLDANLIFDLERSREILLSMTYSQRLSDRWRIRAVLRWIDAPFESQAIPVGLQGLDGNNELRFSLVRGF